MYANAHAQCDVQHTHKQNYIEILGILGVGDLTFGVGYPPPSPPPFCMKHGGYRVHSLCGLSYIFLHPVYKTKDTTEDCKLVVTCQMQNRIS